MTAGVESSVATLWRYPVKSMHGEELNAADITAGGLLGDRRFAVVNPATGKVAGAKNPRKWPGFFYFRAAYTEPPRGGSALPAVRVTNRSQDGTLPSGGAIVGAHGRKERWGRLVKNAGLAGAFGSENAQVPRLVADEERSDASSAP